PPAFTGARRSFRWNDRAPPACSALRLAQRSAGGLAIAFRRGDNVKHGAALVEHFGLTVRHGRADAEHAILLAGFVQQRGFATAARRGAAEHRVERFPLDVALLAGGGTRCWRLEREVWRDH